MRITNWLEGLSGHWTASRRFQRIKRRKRERQPTPVEVLEERVLLAAPTGVDDFYTANDDKLDTAAESLPTVLANDTDPENDPLTASLLVGPNNGSLTLSSDGSFVYQPDTDFVGDDTFTYEVSDGFETDTATVTITVTKPFGDRADASEPGVNRFSNEGVFGTSGLTGGVQVPLGIAPGVTLTYDSTAADASPVIAVETTFTYTTIPDDIEIHATLDTLSSGSTWFDTSNLLTNDELRFAIQMDASMLQTGRYSYQMTIIAHYGTETATRAFSGFVHHVNLGDSTAGDGWNIAVTEELITATDGLLHVRGDGTTVWFKDNLDDTYSAPYAPAKFSTLVKNIDNSYTLTDKYGFKTEFDSAGLLTSHVDTNGNTTSYTYVDADSDGKTDDLSLITGPYGRTTTLAYTSGLLSSVTDNAGEITSLAHDGSGNLTTVTFPDPDDAGPLTSPVVTFAYTSGMLTTVTDPLSNATTLTYDFANRLTTATLPDSNTRQYTNLETQALVDPGSGLGTQSNPAPLMRSYATDITRTDELSRVTTYVLSSDRKSWDKSDPAGNSTVYTYDDNLQLIKITEPDPDGAGPLVSPVTEFAFDENGNRITLTLPDGNTQTWTYDTTLNVPLTFTDELFNVTTFTYDSAGNLLTVTDALANVTTFVYDSNGRVTSITEPDPDGVGPLGQPVTTFAYDTLGRVTTITNPDVTTVTFTYDTADNLLTETDELGNVTTYAYDDLDQLTSVTFPDPDGAGPLASPVISYTYDAAGNVLTQTDPAAGVTTYVYDNRGRVTSVTFPDPDGGGPQSAPVIAFTYDAVGNTLTVTDPLGNVTTSTYDNLDSLLTITDPDPDGAGPLASPVTTFAYDNLRRVTTVTDPLSNVTTLTYDVMSRVTKVTNALSGEQLFTYDAAGQLLTQTDELSRQTSFTYDALGRVTQVQDPLFNNTDFAYDAGGNLSSVTDALGNKTDYTYNIMSRLTKITQPDPDGAGPLTAPVTTFTYDAGGWLLTETDPLSRTTTYAYDNLGRITSVTDPLSNVTSFQYDVLNNLTHVTDPLSNTTITEHDNLSRTIKITDPLNGNTEFAYDTAGNLTSLKDASSNTTTFAYDAMNRQTSETNALSKSRTFVYDAASNLTKITDRNGRIREFSYDALNRPTQEVWKNGSTTVETITFTLDAASQLTGISDSNSTYAFTFDDASRVTQVDNTGTPNVPVVVLDAAYNAVGNRTSLDATVATVADFQNAFTYDNLGRLTQVTQVDGDSMSGDPITDKRVDLAYDAVNQFTTITRYEDLTATNVVAKTTYAYDTAGRLTSLDHMKDTTSFAAYTWTYNAAGQITQFTSDDGTSDYTYDDTGQLTAATHSYQTNETYTYDSTGNRTNTGYTTGTNNQLTSDGTFNYLYDDEGNRTKKTEISSGDYVEYEWDHRNRLTKVTFRDSLDAKTKEVAYTYDVFDRLLIKQVDDNGNGTFDRAEKFVYDGHDVVLVYDDTSSLTTRFLHGPAVDQVFAQEDATGDMFWALADNQGTVRDVADYNAGTDTTTVANHRKFDAFGNITAETNSSIDFRYAYTGRYYDEDSALQYNRARWYDGTTGRWISEDPIGFAAGDANLSRYVGNGPTNATDPCGLELVDPPAEPVPPVAPPVSEENDQIDSGDSIFLVQRGGRPRPSRRPPSRLPDRGPYNVPRGFRNWDEYEFYEKEPIRIGRRKHKPTDLEIRARRLRAQQAEQLHNYRVRGAANDARRRGVPESVVQALLGQRSVSRRGSDNSGKIIRDLNRASGKSPQLGFTFFNAAQNAWKQLPPRVRDMMHGINNGSRPLSNFSNLPPAQRQAILNYYLATYANASKPNTQAVRELNCHRIQYLLGLRPDPPGGIGNFPK